MNKKFLDHFEKSKIRFNYLKSKINNLGEFFVYSEYSDLYKEYSSLKKIITIYLSYKKLLEEINETKSLLNDCDKDIEILILEELIKLDKKRKENEFKINNFFPSNNLYENNNVFMELRSASGGDEASIFTEDLLKMYLAFFGEKTWNFELMSCSYGNISGYKEVIIRIIGSNIFNTLKHESGIHRVQRIPKTESHGRVHTSTCTVAILPEIKTSDSIKIDSSELRVDTYRASGAGGQHVNVTDSAVRIKHIPTGVVAECQNERSQHKNKQKAMSLLISRLLQREQFIKKDNLDSQRRSLIGSGSRSEKIRTYNYINNRITDHRINLTLYKLSEIMCGNLDLIVNKFD